MERLFRRRVSIISASAFRPRPNRRNSRRTANRSKKKILKPLQKAFKQHFPNTEAEAFDRLQLALLLQIDEDLNPEDPTLDQRRKSLHLDLLESIRPPRMTGDGNRLDAIQEIYRSNLITLQLEGLKVDEQTSSYNFWEYIVRVEERYKAKTANGPTEPQ